MGRKRKTRWRHLSIGEVSANEEEDDEPQESKEFSYASSYRHHKSHSLNSIHRHRSASLTFKDRDRERERDRDRQFGRVAAGSGSKMASTATVVAGSAGLDSQSKDKPTTTSNGYVSRNKDKDSAADTSTTTPASKRDGDTSPAAQEVKGEGESGSEGPVHRQRSPHHNSYNGHYNGSYRGHHHNHYNNYHNGYYHHSHSYSGGDKDSGGGGGGRGYHHQNGHTHGHGHCAHEYSGGSNYYHRSNSYNNYRNSHYDGTSGGGHHGGGGRGGGSDYHFPTRYTDRGGGRFQKRRPYFSYHSYGGSSNNGGPQGTGGGSANGEGSPNTPSYNQDEYTKITTPRQDVLFKKGYLSQRKSTAQSSSLESTSTPTTPSASTNGTPDTHSTTGINSDYSEGYENGETDGTTGNGLPHHHGGGNGGCMHPPPYGGCMSDDTVYYGPPPGEPAVFTDPNTGQVYYGQCSSNGEYFDAYPVNPVMLACPNGSGGIYYQLAYPPLDWSGVPQMYPIVATAAPPPQGSIPVDETVANGPGQGSENCSGNSSDSSTSTGSGIGSGLPPFAKNISKIKEFRPAASTATASSSVPSSTTTASTTATNETSTSQGGVSEVPKSETEETNSSPSPSSDSKSTTNHGSGGSGNNASQTQHQQQLNTLPTMMSNMNINSQHGPPQPLPPHSSHLPLPNYMASVPVHHHQHPHPHHHQPQPHGHGQMQHHQGSGGPPPPTSPYMYPPPHPGFVYAAPPIYNGVVVPIAPPASSSATTTTTTTGFASPATSLSSETEPSCSRKKRKNTKSRRRNANDQNDDDDDDDAQLTDESFEGSDGGESPTPDNDKYAPARTTPKDDDEQYKYKIKSTKPYLIDPNNPVHEINQNQNPETTNLNLTPPSKSKTNNNTRRSTSPEEKAAAVDVKESKKPTNLSGLTPFTGETVQDPFSLQISPTTLEPGSPDSFNTTQSVAGSEIVGSVSDDLMNRTTSIDEVEEDLPIEDENNDPDLFGAKLNAPCETTQEATSAGALKQEILQQTSNPRQHEQQTRSSNTIDSTTNNPTSNPITITKSPILSSGGGSNEPSPSPESTFERQIEPVAPILPEEPVKSVRIPLQSLYPTPELQLEEKVEEERVSPLDIKSGNYERARELETHSLELHSVDRVQPAPIILTRAQPKPTPTPTPRVTEPQPNLVVQESITVGTHAEKVEQEKSTSNAERPKSITLAVTEWLKTQGEDALTPASQIVAQFTSAAVAAIEDNDGDIDSEEEEGGDVREGRGGDDNQSLTDSEENQKNAYGNPWVLVSSNKRNRKAALNPPRNQRNANYRNNSNWQNRRPYYYSNNQQQPQQQQQLQQQQQHQQESGPPRRERDSRDYYSAKNGPRKDGNSSRVASSPSYHNHGYNRNYNSHRNYYPRSSNNTPTAPSTLSLNLSESQRSEGKRESPPKEFYVTDSKKSQEKESNNSTRKSHVKVDEEDSGLDLSSPEHHTPSSCPITSAKPETACSSETPIFSGANNSSKSNSSNSKQEESTSTKKKRKGNNKTPVKSLMDDAQASSSNKKSAPSATKELTSSSVTEESHRMSSSSIEESSGTSQPITEDSDSINCDPQNYAKYYQFGVVLEGDGEQEPQDEDEMKDHGIGSGSSTPNSTPPQTPKIGLKGTDAEIDEADTEASKDAAVAKSSSKKKKKKKNSQSLLCTDEYERQSFIDMSTGPVDMTKVMKNCDFYETKMSILMKNKSKAVPIAVPEEDEEIGTFDPANLKSPSSQKGRIVLWKGAGQMASTESSTPPEINEEDYKEFVQSVMKKNASSPSSQHPNLYVNPLSLAAELVNTANANKFKLPDSWDLTEPPLPVYESPPPPSLLNYPPSAYSPVFSHLTPREKLIRTQLTPYGFPSAAAASGNPVSTLMTPATQQAVCCNIQ